MRKIFFIFSASILLLSACVTTSVNLGNDREYYSQSVKACEQIKFTCPEGTQPFSDKTGCGCEDINEEETDVTVPAEESGEVESEDAESEEELEEGDIEEPEEELEEGDIEEPEEEAEESEPAEEEDDSDGPMIIDDLYLEPLEPINIPDTSIDLDDIVDLQPDVIPIPIPDPLPQF